MNYQQKLLSVCFILSFASQCDILAANCSAELRNIDSRLSALEARRSPCLVNPPARPTQKCDWGGYISAEPLFLQARENGLEFVVVTQNGGQLLPLTAGDSANFLSGRTKYKGPDFEWDWGVRTTLGLNLDRDGWEAYATWTWFGTHAKRNVTASPTELLTGTYIATMTGRHGTAVGPSANAQSLFTQSSSHWRLRYNCVNLEIAREFFNSKWLALKPHGGLTTAWIRQKDDIAYNNYVEPATIAIPFPVARSSVSMRNNFWGMGLRFGLESQWAVTCGWSFFGDISASLLYGFFSVKYAESDVLANFVKNDPLFHTQNFFHLCRFIADFIAGIRYDYLFCDERYHLGFQIGWEEHMFFGQNQFPKFPNATNPGFIVANQGDLSLQGVSAQVRFDF